MSTVLVTDAGRGSAVAAIRSIGRQGHRVVAASSDRLPAGAWSRHAAARVRYPRPAEDPAGVVDALLRAVEDHGVDLLLPVADDVLLPVVAARAAFEARCRLAVPADDALAVMLDKGRTVELARSLGIAVPPSVVLDGDGTWPGGPPAWPVVVKPRVSYDYAPPAAPVRRWVGYAWDEAELRRAVRAAGGRAVLQAHHPGVGRGVSMLLEEGRPLAAFQHRRLREVPFTGGASSFRVSEALDPALHDAATRLLGAVGWTGVAMVEFKGDGTDAVLLEVNGRPWGALPLAVAAGMDFPARLATLFLDGPPPPGTPVDTGYRVGVRSRDLDLERSWVAAALRGHPAPRPVVDPPTRREAAAVALSLFRPRDGYDVLDRHDPLPGLAELANVFLGSSWRGLRRVRRASGPASWRR